MDLHKMPSLLLTGYIHELFLILHKTVCTILHVFSKMYLDEVGYRTQLRTDTQYAGRFSALSKGFHCVHPSEL